MSMQLSKISNPLGKRGPVITIVMDGIGIGAHDAGNAVHLSNTPTLDFVKNNYANTDILTHGPYVGLPSLDDMGNSEVGHNAIGAGKVYSQGAKLINTSMDDGSIFKGETWTALIDNCKKNNSALHFIGLLSDGNVHSHIKHLKKKW